jgi:DNA repair protein RecN (Recombination protein N)
VIRAGAETARVEATLEVLPQVKERLQDAGIEAAEESVIFRREISRVGKGRAWINHSPVTAGFLQQIAPLLADIHGQQDQQLLQQPGLHIDLLDEFAGTLGDRAKVDEAFRKAERLRDQLQASALAENERLQRVDFLRFQIQEIEEAGLRPEEEEELQREHNLLTHAEELLRLSGEIYEWLYNRDESALSFLGRAQRNIQRLISIDPKLQGLETTADSARYMLEDVAYQMRDYSRHAEFDPSRLQQVEFRLEKIDRLKKKYAGSIGEILELQARNKEEYSRLANWEENRDRLAIECAEAEKQYRHLAGRLSEQREKAAARMQKAMEFELKSLAMERSRFVVLLQPCEATGKGIDAVEFLVSANPGEPPRALAKIASGGELSRLMLALKTILHGGGGELLVFDEVDSGIGGRVAEVLGLKLKKLASRQQVFCVTHLPQIAAFADIHYRVEKEVRKGRTIISATQLDHKGKLQEVARMLAGSEIGKSALDHARDLISRSAQ